MRLTGRPGGAGWLCRRLCISAGHACSPHLAALRAGGGGRLVAVPRVGRGGGGGRRSLHARWRGGEGGGLEGRGGGGGAAPPRPAPTPPPIEGGCGGAEKPPSRGEGRCPRPPRSTARLVGGPGGGAREGWGLPSDSTPGSGRVEHDLHPAAPPPRRHELADREQCPSVGVAPRAGVLVLRGRLWRPRGWQHRVPHGEHPRNGDQHRGGGCARVPGRGASRWGAGRGGGGEAGARQLRVRGMATPLGQSAQGAGTCSTPVHASTGWKDWASTPVLHSTGRRDGLPSPAHRSIGRRV